MLLTNTAYGYILKISIALEARYFFCLELSQPLRSATELPSAVIKFPLPARHGLLAIRQVQRPQVAQYGPRPPQQLIDRPFCRPFGHTDGVREADEFLPRYTVPAARKIKRQGQVPVRNRGGQVVSRTDLPFTGSAVLQDRQVLRVQVTIAGQPGKRDLPEQFQPSHRGGGSKPGESGDCFFVTAVVLVCGPEPEHLRSIFHRECTARLPVRTPVEARHQQCRALVPVVNQLELRNGQPTVPGKFKEGCFIGCHVRVLRRIELHQQTACPPLTWQVDDLARKFVLNPGQSDPVVISVSEYFRE